MLVLFEIPAGFALFKVLDEGKLNNVVELSKEFLAADSARKVVSLKAFSKFENTAEALEAATKLLESTPSKGLRKFLRAHCDGETLGVADSKLGNAIKEKLKIDCVHNTYVMELLRGVRTQLTELISGLGAQDLAPMSLGLSHSLSRYKLKFSADKVDTMIVQAIGLLDDLDKELNTYAMRIREWYGWHFPELTRIVQDNIHYAKTVKLMLLSSISQRAQLYDYLKSRMNTVAPNLTALVGELVGARLIAHGGSLLNIAKKPGSTVQILGAEKALFRALKTKHSTPKYGLIYHASLVGQAAPKHKGKISRSLAAKAALAIRCDALGDDQDNSMGLENRAKLEARLRALEGKELGRSAGSAKGKPKIEVYDKDRKKGAGLITPAKSYNPAADSVRGQTTNSGALDEQDTAPRKKKKVDVEPQEEEAAEVAAIEDKKEKKKKKKKADQEASLPISGNEPENEEPVPKEKEKKKKKKHQAEDSGENVEGEKEEKKKKKKKKSGD
ncbi:hypothetical protein ES332_A08G249400v1 [Gossypium tomentosum]|uniref:Nop domain-containing protein n=1 Tax=Gossypium tomentosum TaxID=34277 RepID=A0A5D2PNA3_GOSTO|nr:hypothetical protein ES332_A08G249400v1 [Gossypium tomentosum]